MDSKNEDSKSEFMNSKQYEKQFHDSSDDDYSEFQNSSAKKTT